MSAEEYANRVRHILRQREGLRTSHVREIRGGEWMLSVHRGPLTVHALISEERVLLTGSSPRETWKRASAWFTAEKLLDALGAHPARTWAVARTGKLVSHELGRDLRGK